MAGYRNPNPAARHEVLQVLLASRKGLSMQAVAERSGKSRAAVYHLLKMMEADRIVRRVIDKCRKGHGLKYLWHATGRPLPAVPETKQNALRAAFATRLYDVRALCDALGMPAQPPTAPSPSRIHLLKGSR